MPSNGVYVRLSPNLLVWLNGLANAAGVSRSDVVSDALGVLVATVLASPDRNGLGAIYGNKYRGYRPGQERKGE